MPWLEEAYPELVPDYRRLYRGSSAPRAVREALAERVRAEKRRHPTFASPTTPVTARRLPDPPPSVSPPAEPATRLSLGLGRGSPPSRARDPSPGPPVSGRPEVLALGPLTAARLAAAGRASR